MAEMIDSTGGELIVQIDGQVVQTLSLKEALTTIGRTSENDLSLASPQVSRRHAEIRIDQDGVWLVDLGSSNGTRVAGVPMLSNHPKSLVDGRPFEIGPFTISFRSFRKKPAVIGSFASAKADRAGETTTPPAKSNPYKTTRPVRMCLPTEPLIAKTSSYLQYLPDMFGEDDFVGRFLQIFESLWEPLEQRQDHIHMYFDPQTCPASFLTWLATWLDVEIMPGWSEARIRDLLDEGIDLHHWRGTVYGLTRILETTAGISARIVQTDEPFVIRLTVSHFNASGLTKPILTKLIDSNKPAHVGYMLEVE